MISGVQYAWLECRGEASGSGDWGLSAGVAERLGSSAGLECLSLSAVSFSALPESRGEVPGSGDWGSDSVT